MTRFKRRTWGWWIVVLDRKHFKVKLLRFKKGGQLSIQKHKKRNELWLFLKGNGYIGVGPTQHVAMSLLRGSGDRFNVLVDMWHTFKANVVTWVLEVQYGDECTEEDIIRV